MFLVGTDGRISAVQSSLEGMEQMEYEVCLAAAAKNPHLWCGPEGLKGKDVRSLEATPGNSLWKSDWIRWISWRIKKYSCMQKTREVQLGSGSRFSALTQLQRYHSREYDCFLFFLGLWDCQCSIRCGCCAHLF
jgi:hypothetical protein